MYILIFPSSLPFVFLARRPRLSCYSRIRAAKWGTLEILQADNGRQLLPLHKSFMSWISCRSLFSFFPFCSLPPTHASPVVSRFPDTAKTPREELMKRQSMTGALFDRSLIAFCKSSPTRIASLQSAVTSNLLMIVKLCWESIKTGSKNRNFQIHNDVEIDDYPVCQRGWMLLQMSNVSPHDHICSINKGGVVFFLDLVFLCCSLFGDAGTPRQ